MARLNNKDLLLAELEWESRYDEEEFDYDTYNEYLEERYGAKVPQEDLEVYLVENIKSKRKVKKFVTTD